MGVQQHINNLRWSDPMGVVAGTLLDRTVIRGLDLNQNFLGATRHFNHKAFSACAIAKTLELCIMPIRSIAQ
jgi:hypothetical protein